MQLQLYNPGQLSQKQTVSECPDLNLRYRDVGYSQEAYFGHVNALQSAKFTDKRDAQNLWSGI